MTDCEFVAGFASAGEITQLQGWIAPHLHRFREAVGYGIFGPRCRHLGGVQIEQWLPEVVAYGDARVRPAVEEFAGRPLVTASDRGRARRIQIFTHPRHGFRWHYDITPYAALLTLRERRRGRDARPLGTAESLAASGILPAGVGARAVLVTAPSTLRGGERATC